MRLRRSFTEVEQRLESLDGSVDIVLFALSEFRATFVQSQRVDDL